MPRQTSAGVLAWRRVPGGVEFLLVHPGGPFWAGKDAAAWSIPKGLVEPGEDGWTAARREAAEELGAAIEGPAQALAPCPAGGGKTILAWLVESDFDPAALKSNTFEMEWPPRSRRRATFPEVDRAGWFSPQTALAKVHKGQRPIVREAAARLGISLLIED